MTTLFDTALGLLPVRHGLQTVTFLLLAWIALTDPVHSSPAPGTECDELASSLYQRIAYRPEIVDDDLDLSRAETACREALTKYPNSPRLKSLLARVLLVKATRDASPSAGLDDPTLSEALALAKDAASGYSEIGDGLIAEIIIRFGEQKDPAATRHILKAIDAGSHLAIYRLAEWLANEDIAAKLDSDLLNGWIDKWIDQDKYYAKIVLGSCEWFGFLCERDIGHAKTLFTEVAKKK